MKVVVQPFKKLMDRLLYPKKFLLILVLFVIPLTALVSYITYEIQTDVSIAQKERKGLDATLKLQTIIEKVQQHRGLSSTYLNGNANVLETIQQLKEEIDMEMNQFDQYLHKNGEFQVVMDEWEQLIQNWSEIDITKYTPAESFSIHTDLIDKLLSLGINIADTTYLSLEGDLVRHHLGKLITENLIKSTEHMGQARGKGSTYLAGRKISEDQRMELIYLSKIMTENLSDIHTSMDIILNNHDKVRETIADQYELLMKDAQKFSDLITKELLGAVYLTYDSEEFFAYGTAVMDQLFLFIDYNAHLLDRLLAEHIQLLTIQRNMIIITTIVMIVISTLLFTGFYRSVKESIMLISESMGKIADGNLLARVRLETKDEMKEIERSINATIDSLQQLIKSNQDLAIDLSGSAEELSSSSQESAKATEHIAKITQSITYDIEKETKMVYKVNHSIQLMAEQLEEVSANSEKVLERFEQTTQSTKDGVQFVEDVLKTMKDIHTTVMETATLIKNLGESTKQIDKIVAIITEISNQTHLLALNATIEAARAGEHGKGFAVVAYEVSKLADQSKHSAEQISKLIHQIQNETEEAVQSMDKGTDGVAVGLNKVTEVNQIFHRIDSDINDVKEMVASVVEAVGKITAESDEINEAMGSVEQSAATSTSAIQECSAAVEEQLAAMEQITASAESLAAMAEKLQTMINKFKV